MRVTCGYLRVLVIAVAVAVIVIVIAVAVAALSVGPAVLAVHSGSSCLAEAYAAEVEDAPPYNGARLVDWLWTRHASLGFTDEELFDFVAVARACAGTR